jgi:hypothetical protein
MNLKQIIADTLLAVAETRKLLKSRNASPLRLRDLDLTERRLTQSQELLAKGHEDAAFRLFHEALGIGCLESKHDVGK